MRAVLAVFLISGNLAVLAQSNSALDRSYQLLSEDEDWTLLRDRSLRQDFWDPVKFVPLRNSGEWYLTVGGEVREVWEQIGTTTGANSRA